MFRINFNKDSDKNLNISFNGEFIDDHKKLFDRFIDYYEIEDLIFEPDRKDKLKPKNERICRFCNKQIPEVTFKKDAHVMPELMGNRNLISDFECDVCNHFFSKYEDELARFMGLSRTLSFMRGKEGLPKFKTPDKNLIVGKDEESGDPKRIQLVSIGQENNHFEIDKDKKTLTVNSVKHPYTPIKVFKALLKVALSLVEGSELANFPKAFKILMSDEHDDKIKGLPVLRLFVWVCPGVPFPSPLVFLCCKKESKKEANAPSKTMVLYFQNYIYQVFIPFDENDKWLYQKGSEITFPIMSPFLDKTWIDNFGKPKFFNIDLSSSELKKNEKQIISMSFDSVKFDL
jgi:hypothetical protein